MAHMIEAPERVVLDWLDLSEAIPCDEVVPVLPAYIGDPCTRVATLRVSWHYGGHIESWTVCRACFRAMSKRFGGHAVDVHEL